MWQIWLVISLFFFILEIATTAFLIFWFGVGGLIATLCSLVIKNVKVKTLIFIVTSTLLTIFTKPLVDKYVKTTNTTKTNAYSVEGKVGKVTKDIEPIEGRGQVIIDGEAWSAKSFDDSFIPKGTEIKVESLNGVKVIVKPFNP